MNSQAQLIDERLLDLWEFGCCSSHLIFAELVWSTDAGPVNHGCLEDGTVASRAKFQLAEMEYMRPRRSRGQRPIHIRCGGALGSTLGIVKFCKADLNAIPFKGPGDSDRKTGVPRDSVERNAEQHIERFWIDSSDTHQILKVSVRSFFQLPTS